MNNQDTFTDILERINLLHEYQQKSLAIILMQFTLSDYQNDLNFKQYKELIKEFIN